LALLDQVDEQSSSGKLDLIIQLPYIIKSEARKKQAEQRRQEIEDQLTGTKYGIAYTDGTEKVVQLGHPIENNLLKQIEYLTTLLYSQLGLTEAVFNGTAKEEEMLNYYNRTIEPIISAITEECQRKFLTKTARAQRQRITFFRDPFKLVPITQLADLSNSLSRNEVITSNELRAVLGFKPSSDPRADQLINSNINTAEGGAPAGQMPMMDDQSFAQQQEMMTNNIDMYLNQMDSMAQSELSHTGENKPAGGYASKYYDPEKAHEYYEKTKRLKGRRSNKGLNEEGIAAAEYMRNQIDTQHQKELDAKTQETQDYLTKQDEDLESTVTNIKAGLEQALEDLRNSTEKNLESSRNKLKTVIDNATQRTMAQAQQLYEKISNTDNEAAKRGFRNQIEQLRDANAKIKDSLTEGFAEDYAKTQTDAASKKESLTKQASKDVSNAKEKTASNKEQAVESYKKTAAELEEKYGKLIEDEMEKIRNNPAFLEPEKTKKSSSSKTGSRKLPHGNYLKNIEAYKKRNKK
jgi:predicted RNase H-like HicB family nuclease